MTRAILAGAALLFAAGCMPNLPYFGVPEKPWHGPWRDYAVQLPKGWMRANVKDRLLVTRDGLALQRVVIDRYDRKKPLPASKRMLDGKLETFELSELLAGEFSSREGITGFTVLESSPATVSGRPALKLVVAYKDADGLRMKSIFYGVPAERWLWFAVYSAPARHYFDLDAKRFEELVATWVLKKP
jgi:hypothetical protein